MLSYTVLMNANRDASIKNEQSFEVGDAAFISVIYNVCLNVRNLDSWKIRNRALLHTYV
jgi:hypothetical protein